jgi:hypothetical protein
MRKQLIVLGILLHFAAPVPAQVSFGFGFQTDNVSISLSSYPNLVRVPGYPVYYASGLNSNYFFYDGMYWIFETDRWYSSAWYNGPWMMVDPEIIPLYLLRVPVRYYRRPPVFFMGWQTNSPPRWGDHWGDDWAQHRNGWDRWNRNATPAPAPLPTYQRKYSGDRYPSQAQQHVLQRRNYRHEARDPLVRRQSEEARPSRNGPDPVQRGSTDSRHRRNAEPAAAAPSPSPTFRQHEAAAAQPRRARDTREMQRPPQAAPRTEEGPARRHSPPPQREPNRENMRSQANSQQPQAEPPKADRSASQPANSGRHGGQQRERDHTDEHGQGRGR